jgi:hypothetical protein
MPKLARMELTIGMLSVVGMLGLGGIAAGVSLVRRDGYRRVPTRLQH